MREYDMHRRWVAAAFQKGNLVCLCGTLARQVVAAETELVAYLLTESRAQDVHHTHPTGECLAWCLENGITIIAHPTYDTAFYGIPIDEYQAVAMAMRWR